MKITVLAPLAFLITSSGNFLPADMVGLPRAVCMYENSATSSSAPENLWGDWVTVEGAFELEGITFYSNGGMDLRSGKKLRSVTYKLQRNTSPLKGQIFAWPGADSASGSFTVRFLRPSEIALTLSQEGTDPQKILLQKKRDFRAGVWLLH